MNEQSGNEAEPTTASHSHPPFHVSNFTPRTASCDVTDVLPGGSDTPPLCSEALTDRGPEGKQHSATLPLGLWVIKTKLPLRSVGRFQQVGSRGDNNTTSLIALHSKDKASLFGFCCAVVLFVLIENLVCDWSCSLQTVCLYKKMDNRGVPSLFHFQYATNTAALSICRYQY